MTKDAGAALNGSEQPERTADAADLTDAITTGLQELFATIAEEPIPAEFLALLDRIEANERALPAGPDAAPPAFDGAGE